MVVEAVLMPAGDGVGGPQVAGAGAVVSERFRLVKEEIDEFLRDLENKLIDSREGLALRGASTGDCRGVEALEFQTPSTSGSSIMAFSPNGISSLGLTFCLNSACSTSVFFAVASLLILNMPRTLTRLARNRTKI